MAFPILLATLPLGAYLITIGTARLRGRVVVTTGGRNTFALAIAISGLVAVGPAELFFPSAAGVTFGPAVWPMLGILYLLMTSLVVLNQRQRLVVLGLSAEGIVEPLLRACQTLDPSSRVDEQAGTLTLPAAAIHLRLIPHTGSLSADIEAFQTNVTPEFWQRLLTQLRAETDALPKTAVGAGGVMTVVGSCLLALAAIQLLTVPGEVLLGLKDWLWR